MGGGGALAAVGVAIHTASAQAAKIAPAAAHYQETPKGNAQCDNCRYFVATGACRLVVGAISPSGWCTLYAAKR